MGRKSKKSTCDAENFETGTDVDSDGKVGE
jgi:hypothetical protein